MTDQDLMQQRRMQVFHDYEQGTYATVTELCAVHGFSRTWFYKWKARWEADGPVGLRSRRPGPDEAPHAIDAVTRQQILDYILRQPSHGAQRIAWHSEAEVSGMTVQRYLHQWNLNTMAQRQLFYRLHHGILTEADASVWARDRAASQHRHLQVDVPGELVGVDLFYVGTLKGIGRIYQFTAIDCASSFGWAALFPAKTATNAVQFIEQDVRPTFADHRALQRVLTDNGKEFTTHWDTDQHQFTQAMQTHGITQTTTKVRHPWTNGHVERFQQTLLHEFYQPALQATRYPDIAHLQADLESYLQYYNFHRRHHGDRLQGKVPATVFFGGAFPQMLPAG